MNTCTFEHQQQNKVGTNTPAGQSTSSTSFVTVATRAVDYSGRSTVWLSVGFRDGGITFLDNASGTSVGTIRIVRGGSFEVWRGDFQFESTPTRQNWKLGSPIMAVDMFPLTAPASATNYVLEFRVSAATATLTLSNYVFQAQVL